MSHSRSGIACLVSIVPLSTILVSSFFALQLNKILNDYDRTLEMTYKTYLPYGHDGMRTQEAEQRALLARLR